MKIKQFLMAAAALMLAVSCNPVEEPDPVEPSFTPETWSVVGTNNGWDAAGAPAMAYENEYYVAQDVEFEAGGEFKLVKDNAWTVCRSYAGEKPILAGYYYAVQQRDGEGTNIVVKEAGKYDIYLNKATDKLYMMADGAKPADAQDGETIVVAPEAVATISYVEEEITESSITFYVTTANVVAASWGVLASDMMDETINAEYVLSEDGGYALEGEELNAENVAVGLRRGITAGTAYTLLLAYEDAEGNKVLVTEEVTTPAPATPSEYVIMASEYMMFNDEEFGDYGSFNFYGTDYELVVFLETCIRPDVDYSFEDYISQAFLKDADGNKIEDVVSGVFSVYAGDAGGDMYMAYALMQTASGINVEAMYEGPISELAGSGAGGEKDFIVAYGEAFALTADDPSVWGLNLTSTDGDTLFLAIDTGYDDCPFLAGGMYNIFMSPSDELPYGIYMYESYALVNMQQGMFVTMTENEFVWIESAYDGATPETDMNMVSGRLTATNPYNGQVIATLNISCQAPITLYSANAGGGDGGVITKDVGYYVTDPNYEGWCLYGAFEAPVAGPGLELNFCDAMYMTDLYFYVYDYSQGTDTIEAVSVGFYPMISEPTTSGVWAKTDKEILLDGVAYYLAMPEDEADENGRKYGVTVTIPDELAAETCVFEAYLTATDWQGKNVVLDLKYTGPLVSPWSW